MSTQTSAERKREPMWSGAINYFHRTLRAISRVSFKGNEKHNPGEPLHWSKDKSGDHADCSVRHQATPYEIDPESGELHLTHAAWRTCAWNEIVLESIERGICTLDDFRTGRVTVAEAGKRIAALDAAEASDAGNAP